VAKQKNKVVHCTKSALYSAICYLVYNGALLRVTVKVAKLHRVKAEQPELPRCSCVLQKTLRLLCYYVVFERRNSLGYLLFTDFYAHWYYDCLDENTLEIEHKQLILEPAIVKGKGRPKGAKGKAKGQGASSMIETTKISCIGSTNDMTLGTQRDPLLFEIPSSTALAVLGSGIVLAKRTAAAMLLNSFEVTETSPGNWACTVPILRS
jgi:hypothetical protein